MNRAVMGLAATLLVASLAWNFLRPLQAQAPPQVEARAEGGSSVQDALLKPYDFTFPKPTPLDEVVKHLAKTLHAPVAIDRAAIDRQGLKIDDEVVLDLKGVRLKTGLKLLLDQLDLTFKVVAEDNLLIITDAEGSSDPVERILQELKALHKDVHDAQDALDDLRDAIGVEKPEGAPMHNPTIIEEVPPGERPKDKPRDSGPETKPRSKPGA